MQPVFRWIFAGLVTLCVVPGTAWGERVIILGFDGVDPRIAEEMMDKGELPNLAKLREEGTFTPLASSNPPQSPTAWSSFNTCRTPFNHGIFDFLRRDPQRHLPAVGFGSTTRPELGPDGSLSKAPEYVNNRLGDTFWKIASDQGKRVKALVVPFAYPADDLSEECRQLCGLDVPDIRGTQSTYFALSESFERVQNLPGGVRLPLNFEDDVATVEVPGLGNPRERGATIDATLKLAVDREGKRVTFTLDSGEELTVAEGAWSDWHPWRFEVSPLYTVDAVSRFHVMEVKEDEVRVYMSCLQFHPDNPMIPFTSPGDWSKELKERYGLFKTIGWVYDTKALQQGDMTEEMFLEDVARTMEWRKQLCLDEMDRGDFDLLIAAWTGTDRVSHMFWAYRDPAHPLYTEEMAEKYGRAVEDTYIKMDEIVGEVRKRMEDDDLLMIMSDHGFHSFRTEFNVNKWLIDNGYLAVRGGGDHTDQRFMQGFDWANTKAYGLGLGMIFLNLEGREGRGIVKPEDAEDLVREIAAKLEAVVDPETGDKVFSAVYPYIDPQGEALADIPDIQLGYADGYQTSKASAAGSAPKELFSPNLDKWSGEHASSDVANTPGIFYSNRKIAEAPSLIDLGVTAFDYLGLEPDPKFEGRSVLPQD